MKNKNTTIMEPTAIFGNGKQPSDNGTVSFEELENAFKTPTQRQDYFEAKTPPQDINIPESLSNPDGSAGNEETLVEAETVSPEHAQRTGERIARLVDTGIDFALSNFVARNGETYRADEKDLKDIAECWGELAQEKGWSIGPELSLVILYIMVYGPLVKQAVTDRRIAELEERQKQIEERQRKVEEILKKEGQQKPTSQERKPDGNEDPIISRFTHQPAQE